MPTANQSITVRLDKRLLRRLKRVSEEKKVSINTLCMQILTQYDQWHAHASSAGIQYYPQELVRLALEKIPEEEISVMAEKVASSEKSRVLVLKGSFSIEDVLDSFFVWIKTCNLGFRYEVENDTHTFVVTHNAGRKWSLYLVEYLRRVISSFSVRKIQSDYTDTTIMFKVDISK